MVWKTQIRDRSRGWGPFSGAQLTVVIVTLAVLFLFPVGAWAVTGSNVFVADAGSGQRAFVSGAGQVNVTRAGAKSYFISHFLTDPGPGPVALKPPAGKALVITSLFFAVAKPFTPADNVGVLLLANIGRDDCTGTLREILAANPPASGLIQVPLDPGLVIPAHRALCIQNENPAVFKMTAWGYGYTIPASAAPTEIPTPAS
jgi:hypothetical protein